MDWGLASEKGRINLPERGFNRPVFRMYLIYHFMEWSSVEEMNQRQYYQGDVVPSGLEILFRGNYLNWHEIVWNFTGTVMPDIHDGQQT